MGDGEGHSNNTVATLDANGSKSRFGVAYLRSVCSQAGVGFDETSADEDTLAVDGNIQFAAGPAAVQVKCTGKFKIDSGPTATWPAEIAWREKWNKKKVPIYFVLVILDPDVQTAWLKHHADGTLLNAAAFWVRVNQLASDTAVIVPKSQRLTAETLERWAADVDACFGPVGGVPYV